MNWSARRSLMLIWSLSMLGWVGALASVYLFYI